MNLNPMRPFHRRQKGRAVAFVIALCCFSAISLPRDLAAFDGSRQLFTEEEKEVRSALQDEFAKMGPRGHVLRGTLLYLMTPHRSKYYNVNSLGIRGGEARPKTTKGFSVMVMGGAAVFGDDAKADFQTIPACLEKLLREKHPDREIQVYNLGISGYVFQREVALAKRLEKQLDPDLVIFYHGGNDVTRAYNHLDVRLQPFGEKEEVFFMKKQNESWGEALGGLTRSPAGRAASKMGHRPVRSESEKIDSFVKGYLQCAKDAANHFKSKNIPVLFVIQPALLTRKNRTPREQDIVDFFVRPHFPDYIRQCVAKLRAGAGSEGIAVHDFTGVFDQYKGTIFIDGVHVNAAGNKFVAERLADIIESGGYLKAASR